MCIHPNIRIVLVPVARLARWCNVAGNIFAMETTQIPVYLCYVTIMLTCRLAKYTRLAI